MTQNFPSGYSEWPLADSGRTVRGGGQIATPSQIPEGRILNVLEVPVQRTTKMLDASPIEMDSNGNRATGTISLPSCSESWQKRISSMGWLSTSIVHDLRNPLGTVFAAAEMLMQLDPASTQGKRLVANIYRAAVRMRELLADLAGASCGNKSTCEICEIRAVIIAASETALLTTESQGFEIVHEVPEGLEIPVQRSRIERVFFNLITNALEAMPHGGQIRIGARKGENIVLIDVEDTGPGIPRAIRDRLFEPFVTAGKDHGLGLGLALSRQTVLDHGGDMWTEPAAGARFVIRLPLTGRHPGYKQRVSSAMNDKIGIGPNSQARDVGLPKDRGQFNRNGGTHSHTG